MEDDTPHWWPKDRTEPHVPLIKRIHRALRETQLARAANALRTYKATIAHKGILPERQTEASVLRWFYRTYRTPSTPREVFLPRLTADERARNVFFALLLIVPVTVIALGEFLPGQSRVNRDDWKAFFQAVAVNQQETNYHGRVSQVPSGEVDVVSARRSRRPYGARVDAEVTGRPGRAARHHHVAHTEPAEGQR